MTNDFDQIVDSYLPAAAILAMTRSEVESAVLNATRFDHRCESCRHSRAPHGAVTIAEMTGGLPVYKRRCGRAPLTLRCPRWERLEIPQEFLERDLEVRP